MQTEGIILSIPSPRKVASDKTVKLALEPCIEFEIENMF